MTTPARRQYLEIKANYPDAILLYQVGDFYETFDEDARVAASELQIVLTGRSYGPGVRVPLAGVPLHALQGYAARLVERGYKVAICDQVSPPGRGLVRREVTRVLTPGTVADPAMVPTQRDNYLAAIVTPRARSRADDRLVVGLAYVEVSSGVFVCGEWDGATRPDALRAELERLRPAEILMAQGSVPLWGDGGREEPSAPDSVRWPMELSMPTTIPTSYFDAEEARVRLCRHLGVPSLDPFGCEGMAAATSAAGALVAYVQRMNPALLRSMNNLRTLDTSGNVEIDGRTWRALEVVDAAASRRPPGAAAAEGRTLLATLNYTRTSMGCRALRRQLLAPTTERDELETRLDAVEELVGNVALRQRIDALLRGVGDGERLAARIAHGTATPRELLVLSALLACLPDLAAALSTTRATRLRDLRSRLDACNEVQTLIGAAIDENASAGGRTLRDGFSDALDAVVEAGAEARLWIAALEPRERERTGIKSLKVGYNHVFGYYLEISHAHTARVPDEYERRQTLTGGERYVTPELKVYEARVLHSDEQIAALERDLYARLLEDLARHQDRLRTTAAAVAHIDVLLSLAEAAARGRYVRPELTNGTELIVRGGRHPMLDGALDGREFIANDITFDDLRTEERASARGARVMLLTGPNMAGKSTYLRQVALIALLAHVGSFVPAEYACIGMVDRIFTRVGAEDDLSAGLSTFMLEMLETAFILRHATDRSLVALDEVGRGTSTRDGLAIARAVTEYLHDEVHARTLFATHFHELAELAESLPQLRLYRMDVAEREGRTVFLHRVVAGASDESYGVHVARMAGIPTEVTCRADDLLAQSHAEVSRAAEGGRVYAPSSESDTSETSENTENTEHAITVDSLASHTRFSSPTPGAEQVMLALASVNIAATTPLEGLNLLFSLQQRALAILQQGGE